MLGMAAECHRSLRDGIRVLSVDKIKPPVIMPSAMGIFRHLRPAADGGARVDFVTRHQISDATLRKH